MTSKRAGFTLIELLVVVTIIGILISLLFPVYTTVIRSVQETYCQGNLGQLAKVISAYCQANDGYFPFVGKGTTVPPSASDWLYVADRGKIALLSMSKYPYGDMEMGVLLKNKLVGKMDTFYCPTDMDAGLVRGPQNSMLNNTLHYEIFGTNPAVIRPATSYVINGSITYGNTSFLNTRRCHKMSNFGAWCFLFIEESSGDTDHGERPSACNKAYMIPYTDTENTTLRWLTSRHRGGGYIACMDGHVEWMLPENPDNATDSNTFKASMDQVRDGVGSRPWYYVTKTRWNP
ncbi:MAG: type II secretion system protein [Planctomycetota bacterium]|nr:type II secretion system protein [Planctomycetota bacterium]